MISPGILSDIISGALFLVLGGFVASRRPRMPGNLAFAVFAAAFGATYIVVNVPFAAGDLWAQHAGFAVAALLHTVAAGALARLATRFPPGALPPGRRELRWTIPLTLFIASPNVFLLLDARALVASYGLPPDLAPTFFLWGVTTLFMTGATGYASLVWAFRFDREPDARVARSYAIVTLALGAHGGIIGGIFIAGYSGAAWPLYAGVASASGVPLIAVWLRNIARARDPARSAIARNVALALATLTLVGMLVLRAGGTIGDLLSSGFFGILRAIVVIALAYAILRLQLLGLDVRVRFAISKSTIAAVFIAVFFIVSEAAQQFFGETLESTYLGIAAAGALVFAMAPLQRAAERLAEKAVPVAGAPASAPSHADRREEVFLKAARLALRAGLSRDEEVHLAELADELGIGAGRAAALLRDAERETRAGVA